MPVEFPIVVTYLGTYLISDTSSGVWVVIFSEWAAKYASYVSWDLAYIFRLWFIPQTVSNYMPELDVSFMLGSAFNYAELLELLNAVDGIEWMDLPVFQARTGSRIQDASSGLFFTGGNFLWYEPYLK